MLEFEDVSIGYGGLPVVGGVSFSLQPGEILGIVGESGSGKSTLLKAALGLLGPAGSLMAGRVRFLGEDLAGLTATRLRELRGPEIGMVFQDSLASFTPTRKVGDLFYEVVSAHEKLSRDACTELAAGCLSRLNIEDPQRILESYPFELSGGLGQRVGIAMAIALRPQLLLADEPTSALDVVSQKEVIGEFARLRAEGGTGIVLATHNIGVVRALADAVLVLESGRVVEQGPARGVLEHPKSAYTRQLIDAVPRLERKGR